MCVINTVLFIFLVNVLCSKCIEPSRAVPQLVAPSLVPALDRHGSVTCSVFSGPHLCQCVSVACVHLTSIPIVWTPAQDGQCLICDVSFSCLIFYASIGYCTDCKITMPFIFRHHNSQNIMRFFQRACDRCFLCVFRSECQAEVMHFLWLGCVVWNHFGMGIPMLTS